MPKAYWNGYVLSMAKEDQRVKRWRARAIMGSKEPTQLVLARRVGESFTVRIGDDLVEVTVASIGQNSVALVVETSEKNLVLRKELE